MTPIEYAEQRRDEEIRQEDIAADNDDYSALNYHYENVKYWNAYIAGATRMKEFMEENQ